MNRRTNTSEMTAFLGGPETVDQLDDRHARYLDLHSCGEMFVAMDGETAVGTTGYWEHEEGDQVVWETGWAVLPFQYPQWDSNPHLGDFKSPASANWAMGARSMVSSARGCTVR